MKHRTDTIDNILWYCLSKNLRISGMTIDDIGLQPDYYLDKAIPEYQWVEYVNNILNDKPSP